MLVPMGEVRIPTPRGLELAGTFIDPVDSTDAAVIFSHSIFADRRSAGHFERLAREYRAAGYATLEFDYSGHGTSGDDIITLEAHIEDVQAASGWLSDQGFTRQALHAHSFGTLPGLRAHLPAVRTVVASSAPLGPISFEWTQIFSAVQLDDLEVHGVTTVPDDSPGPRRNFTISKQTLIDLSLTDPEALLRGHEAPTLLIMDGADVETGLLDLVQDAFPLLPDGSRLEVVTDARFGAGEHPERLSELSLDWVRRHLPVTR